jgi:F-type H+-transporting ATPase subunit b
VIEQLIQFASTEAEPAAAGGLSALGLNLQAFLFQLITFVLVLLLLRKYVWGKLVETLEARRIAVERSLDQAAETAKELDATREKIAGLIKEARSEADGIVQTAHKEAAAMVEEADEKARKRAEHIINDAKSQIDQDVLKAREALKKETQELVAIATERIIKEKISPERDSKLIKEALQEAK